ncbi:MAG: hypothetical protein HKN72_01535 [Gemmatimonadetes bacterium]|nr:hypothetical protein [Gemmatimonadota bacterium]NNF11872.1 hypothetical protein [Gemmatimonadota bacterium]NNL30354.1 hypothetical protein [Gemmatimonadota bacterium]
MSNQTRLFILVFLAFLPTVALFVHADRSLNEAAIESHEAEMVRLASRAGSDYRQILQDTESLLGALSEMTEFRDPSPQCNGTLSAIMDHMYHYTAIQLIEPDGFVTCGSLAIDESLFVGDRYYHRAAMASGDFTVGEFVVGRLTAKPIVGLAHPVEVAGEARGILAAYLDLDELANRIFSSDVPQGATLTVIDRRGKVMIRVPAGASAMGTDTIGAYVPETFPEPTGETQNAYMLDGLDLDGVSKHFAVQPLEAGGQRASGHLLIGMTEENMLASTEVAGTRRLQLLAVGALFMFVLAWMFGHYTLLRDRPKEA